MACWPAGRVAAARPALSGHVETEGTAAAPASAVGSRAIRGTAMPVKLRASKQRRHRITAEAVAAFKRMQAERDGSTAWWHAHHALHDALGLPPWIFPFDGTKDEVINPMSGGVTTGELWRELE